MAEEQQAEEAVEEAVIAPEEAAIESEEDFGEAEEPTASLEDFNSFEAFSKLRDSLPDENLKKHMSRFQSFEDAAKASREARQEISKAIKPISQDSKPSEVAAFRKALGVPDSVDDYQVSLPEGVDEAVFQSEDVQNELAQFAEVAHKNNVSAPAFDAIVSKYFEQINQNQVTMAQKDEKFATEGEAALKEKWGAQYPGELELANRGLEFSFSNGLDAVREMKTSDGRLVADHPVFIEAMNKIGRAVNEDSVSSFPVDSVAEQGLRSQLEQLTSDQADAQLKGEYQKAQSIDLQIMEISRKISGDHPIVGA